MKKLKLNKETIALLNDKSMKEVEGGANEIEISGANCTQYLPKKPKNVTFFAKSVCCKQL